MYRGRGGYNNNNNNNSNRGGYGGGNRGNRNGGYTNNPTNTLQRANEYVNQNMITVEIQGWDNATQQELINFLSRKTKIIVTNPSVDMSGKILQGKVRSMRDAQDLVKCSGMRFAGQSLFIRISDSTGINNVSGAKNNTIELLKQFLISRYNSASKMLDLQNLQNDQTLNSNGLFSNSSTASKFFPALMKIAEKEIQNLDSVNLSNNNIDDYSKWVYELSLSYPNIKNIALTNNNIKKIEFFEKLKNKFNNLRELIIQGNPLSQNISFMQKIVTIFPRLVILDGTQVRDETKLEAILTFPIKSEMMFFENEDLSKIANNFISSYLNFWDNNRMDLMSLYTQQSQFSYQCDSSVISEFTSSSPNLWNNYTSHSRNFKRVSNEKSRMMKLSIGPEQILNTFRCLPKTKHSLDIKPNDYSIEVVSYPALNGMIITIHGDFEEVAQSEQQFSDITANSNSNNNNNRNYNHNRYKNNYNQNKRGTLEKRGFDRVFIVVPGPNGAFIVASDMLCVKQYTANKPWVHNDSSSTPDNNNNNSINTVTNINPMASSTPPQQPHAGIPISGLPADISSKLNAIQQELVLKVMQETRLKLEFALMLCEQSNWDYNTAGQNFVNSKANIPPDAYV